MDFNEEGSEEEVMHRFRLILRPRLANGRWVGEPTRNANSRRDATRLLSLCSSSPTPELHAGERAA